MADNIFSPPLSPIQRSTPLQRLLVFEKNEAQIYNKYSPFYQAGTPGIGPEQPYIYTKLTDGNGAKDYTKYDSQAFPVGSMARDVKRLFKFTTSGKGLMFLGKQILIQGQAPFDETRTYNPGSVIGSAGTIFPTGRSRGIIRHIEGGGLLNFFVSSLFSSAGIQTNFVNATAPIPGTATGALPQYVKEHQGGRYGLLRSATASTARGNFDFYWGGVARPSGRRGLLSAVFSSIASTTGLFSNTGRPADWTYRPEYKSERNNNAYDFMYADVTQRLTAVGKKALYSGKNSTGGTISTGRFYNDTSRDIVDSPEDDDTSGVDTLDASDVMKNLSAPDIPSAEYAGQFNINERYNAARGTADTQGLAALYNRMFEVISTKIDAHPIYNKSAERYTDNTISGVTVSGVTAQNNYKTIPNNGTGATPYSVDFKDNEITIDERVFAITNRVRRLNKPDEYNKLSLITNGTRGQPPDALVIDSTQSKDLIFFYFYDIVNNVYIPFRATINGIQDQHSPEWEDIKYIGRADRLLIYKGFTRDISFSFKVYANSIQELIPMWERVNYLVGLARPSKYTGRGIATAGPNAGVSETNTSGRESEFIYPPMIEFRIGDLYVDQPAAFRSISVTIPEDAQWEMLRDDNYVYRYGIDKIVQARGTKSRQLPNMVDVSVQLSVLEREQASTANYHFGKSFTGWNTL
jgi:hypothetical protein